jgi:6-phosphogluconolactonase (cycloisomerase 2 family)
VLARNATTGKTTNRQVIKDEHDDVHGLAGAMGIATSADGRYVYVSSGRFGGDDAVSVYGFNKEGDLALVQELINDHGELINFRGGNEITVSPDGKNVYAVASKSSSLSCFTRDQETGKLRFLETILDDNARLKAVAGVCVSPDGKFVYAAAEQGGAISIFRRK